VQVSLPVTDWRPAAAARLVLDAKGVAAAYDAMAAAMALRLSQRPSSLPVVLLGILTGGAMPLVQLAQRLGGGEHRLDLEIDTCRVSRYGHAVRGQGNADQLQWLAAPRPDLHGRHVVVVDDIFDEGWTLEFVHRHLQAAGARVVQCAVLVHKHHSRPVAPLVPDFVGVDAGDEFLVGCGMDYQGRWRHLPELYALEGLTDHGE
jgi:hypoxanthine phosphoribosyltransferase